MILEDKTKTTKAQIWGKSYYFSQREFTNWKAQRIRHMNEVNMVNSVSLFVDGLPWEMSWDWLMQIFSGEGEIIDVFVSKKRRRFSGSCFGFVQFKKVEEAMSAIRNLDGTRIRGRSIKVSFAKYDKQGKSQESPILVEMDKGANLVGGEVVDRMKSRDGRSFKEVVMDVPKHLKEDRWGLRNCKPVTVSKAGGSSRQDEKVRLKEMAWSLVDEIFESGSVEESMRNIGALLEVTLQSFEDGSPGYRKFSAQERKNGEKEHGGAFLEEDLLLSMMNRRRDVTSHPIGGFDLSCSASLCCLEVGSVLKSMEEAKLHPFGPCLEDDNPPDVEVGSTVLGLQSPASSELGCPPGFENFKNGIDQLDQLISGDEVSCGSDMHAENSNDHFQRSSGDQSCHTFSIEVVPQTPVFESGKNCQEGVIEIVLPFEERLMEAQITRDIGACLGITTSNEVAMLTALSKIREGQDFALPKSRRRSKKK